MRNLVVRKLFQGGEGLEGLNERKYGGQNGMEMENKKRYLQ